MVPLSPTKSVSFTEAEREVCLSRSFLKEERSPEEKCTRTTHTQKGHLPQGQSYTRRLRITTPVKEPRSLTADQISERQKLILKPDRELQQRRAHNAIYFIATNGLPASQQPAKLGLFPSNDSSSNGKNNGYIKHEQLAPLLGSSSTSQLWDRHSHRLQTWGFTQLIKTTTNKTKE